MRSNGTGRRQGLLIAGAVCAPIAAHAAALAASVEPSEWLSLAAPVRWSLAADAVLFTTVSMILCAPVAGAAVAAGCREGRKDGRVLPAAVPLAGAVLLFAAVSAILTFGWRVGRGDELGFVARSHITLAAAAAALAGIGALCAARFRNVLDAGGAALFTALVASAGLLVGGAGVGDLPGPVITAGLTASPLIAVASAAEIDIVRSDLLYQISPLAHMQIHYSAWSVATACYLALTSVCMLTLTATDRRLSSALHR
jgi:hypothetical protein